MSNAIEHGERLLRIHANEPRNAPLAGLQLVAVPTPVLRELIELAKRAVPVALKVHCPDCGWKGSTTSKLHDDELGDLLCPRAGCPGVLAASRPANRRANECS